MHRDIRKRLANSGGLALVGEAMCPARLRSQCPQNLSERRRVEWRGEAMSYANSAYFVVLFLVRPVISAPAQWGSRLAIHRVGI